MWVRQRGGGTVELGPACTHLSELRARVRCKPLHHQVSDLPLQLRRRKPWRRDSLAIQAHLFPHAVRHSAVTMHCMAPSWPCCDTCTTSTARSSASTDTETAVVDTLIAVHLVLEQPHPKSDAATRRQHYNGHRVR